MSLTDENSLGKKSGAARPLSVMDKVRKASKDGQSVHIEDMNVDGLTAKTVIRIYDGLSPERKEKFSKLPVKKMICKAFEMAERGR